MTKNQMIYDPLFSFHYHQKEKYVHIFKYHEGEVI
jgi:hypothetical protein